MALTVFFVPLVSGCLQFMDVNAFPVIIKTMGSQILMHDYIVNDS